MTSANPLSDLMYDWLTVLHSKAEGLAAYEKYIRDAEAAGSQECVAMFRKLHERDSQLVKEVKDHVYGMIRQNKGG
jgi:hypothetical protein